MSIRPLQDRILVQRLEAKTTTASGIIIPESAKERPSEGRVIAVGNGRAQPDGTLLKPDVKEGDSILFSKYSGTEVKVNGEDLLILREDDILGVLV